MALTSIPEFWSPVPSGNAIPAFAGGMLMDASAEKLAWMFRAPKTGTLDKFEFRVGTVAINAASVVRVSFQDFDGADEGPDEVQDQFRDIAGSAFASDTWMVPGLITSDGTDTGTKRVVTKGDQIACVVEYQTFTAADSVSISTLVNGATSTAWDLLSGFPFATQKVVTWAPTANLPLVVLKYNDGSYAVPHGIIWPTTAFNSVAFNNASTPDERGLLFQMPVECVIDGVLIRGSAVAGTANFDIVLYRESTTLLTMSIDGNNVRTTDGQAMFFVFDDITINANTDHRFSLRPSTANNVRLLDCDFASSAIRQSVMGAGSTWQYTERTDAGAWTQTDTKMPLIGLRLRQIHAAGGAAGGGIRLAGHGGLAA